MSYKKIYAIQPYEVGQKGRTSKAMIIPAGIVKELHIDKNTILILRSYQNGILTIETIKGSEQLDQKSLIPVEKSIAASTQQESTSIKH
jgi:antitoxin component of MazEF toxin-antitoxin module